jgi:hypothetical protein
MVNMGRRTLFDQPLTPTEMQRRWRARRCPEQTAARLTRLWQAAPFEAKLQFLTRLAGFDDPADPYELIGRPKPRTTSREERAGYELADQPTHCWEIRVRLYVPPGAEVPTLRRQRPRRSADVLPFRR